MKRSDREILDWIHEQVTDQLEDGVREVVSQSLQELIVSDERVRRLYVQYMQDTHRIRVRLSGDAGCSRETGEDCREPVELADKGGFWKFGSVKLLGFAALSAMLLLSAGVAWLVWRPAGPEDHQVASRIQYPAGSAGESALASKAVATLVRSSGTVWGRSSDNLTDLSRLIIGQDLRLDRGSAEIVFDTGVEALLLAPAQLKVLGPNRVSSEYGRFSARVGDTGIGFVIETPMARVTDLGTEFGVSIGESGQTEVAVFEGEVDLEFGSAADRRLIDDQGIRERLIQGEAVRIDSSGARTRVVSIDDSHLPGVRQLPPVFQRLPAIGSVRDNISEQNPSSRKFYRIIHGGFREECQAFVDRPHQWNGITSSGLPKELLGADYVMPFNDDKFASDLEVNVSITRPATVYVLFSDNVSVPEWLSRDFVDTGLDVGLDEGQNRFKPQITSGIGPGVSIDTVFSVWKQEIDSPRTITMESVKKPESTDGYNMYGVAVVGH